MENEDNFNRYMREHSDKDLSNIKNAIGALKDCEKVIGYDPIYSNGTQRTKNEIYDNSKESIKAAKSVVVPIEIEYAQRIEKRLKYTIFLHS